MDNATPSNEIGQFDSLDSRIIQFYYAIIKLKSLIQNIKAVQESLSVGENNDVPYLPYMTSLCGSVFNINDTFMKRLETLSNFGIYNHTVVNVSTATGHIPYDSPDWIIRPIGKLPSRESALQSLKLFEQLSSNALQSYQKKLLQAKSERLSSANKIQIETYFDVIHNLIDPTESELLKDFIIPYKDMEPDTKDGLENKFETTTTKIDLDIKYLSSINSQIKTALEKYKVELTKFRNTKSNDISKNLAKNQYSLHRIATLTFRLNDLYSIYRSIGRRSYLLNSAKLHDPKYIFYSKQSDTFTKIINSTEIYLNSGKKNGVLMASITKLIKKDMVLKLDLKNISDTAHFADQGYVLIKQFSNILKDFQMQWISAEINFRKVINQPYEKLLEDYQNCDEVKESADKLMNLDINNSQKKTIARRSSVIFSNKSDDLLQPIALRKLKTDGLDPNEKKLSRTSSLSSMSSKGSITSLSRTPSKTPSRKNSMTSPRDPILRQSTSAQGGQNSKLNNIERRNSMYLQPLSPSGSIRSPSGSLQKRPSSVIYSSPVNDSSFSSLGSTNNQPSPSGRRPRSNSQPIRSDLEFATSGAALALGNRTDLRDETKQKQTSINGELRKSNSIKRAPSRLKMAQTPSSFTSSPSASPSPFTSSQPFSQAEDSPSGPQRLSASQRFQQHLKNGSRSGSLTTQKNNTFQTYTFDPSSPSLRKPQTRMKPSRSPSPSGSPTRRLGISQQNNRLTRKPSPLLTFTPDSSNNSVEDFKNAKVTPVSQIPSIVVSDLKKPNNERMSRTSSISQSGKSSSEQNSIKIENSQDVSRTSSTIKKVRFEGVPAYTEAEDAPSTANKVLKNFAVFNKIPTKRREQKLKEQEGSLFLQSRHQSDAIPAGRISMMKSLKNPQKSLLDNLAPKSSSGSRFSRLKGKVF